MEENNYSINLRDLSIYESLIFPDSFKEYSEMAEFLLRRKNMFILEDNLIELHKDEPEVKDLMELGNIPLGDRGERGMKFSIGDRIVLNRTGEEGHVTAFINTKMVEVEVGGTMFPVHLEDIDHPYLKWFTDKTAKKEKVAAGAIACRADHGAEAAAGKGRLSFFYAGL